MKSQHGSLFLKAVPGVLCDLCRYGGTEFRKSDKVMQIKNNYEKGVYNGAMGTIDEVDTKEKVQPLHPPCHKSP